MKNIINLLLYAVVATFLFSDCKKFLVVKSNNQPTLENYFTTLQECRAATGALYNKVWYQFSSQFYFDFGDGRGNIRPLPESRGRDGRAALRIAGHDRRLRPVSGEGERGDKGELLRRHGLLTRGCKCGGFCPRGSASGSHFVDV